MTKTLYAKTLNPGIKATEELFAIKEIQKHKTKGGDPYFRITLADKTGVVSGMIWKDSIPQCNPDNLKNSDVVLVDFETSLYNNDLQLSIKKISIATDYDRSELLKMSNKDLDGMYSQLIAKLDSMKDKDLRGFALSFVNNPEIKEKLKTAIAAEKVHHDYIGGLLEHTLEMMEMAETSVKLYPRANRSIVLTGILFHDIGKIDELGVDNTNMIRTKEGYLVGHIMIGYQLFQKYLPIDFPEEKKLAIEHIIISHHRELEFGALVKPCTIEAIIVSLADFTSSNIRMFQKDLDETTPDETGFGQTHKFHRIKIYHTEIPEEE